MLNNKPISCSFKDEYVFTNKDILEALELMREDKIQEQKNKSVVMTGLYSVKNVAYVIISGVLL